MALIHHRTGEVHLKIVYCGPAMGGKTTNLKILAERLPAERRGKLLSVATEHERTLFFDFMPVELAPVNGFRTRFHLYTVPGQVYYRLSRRAVLQGVDALVFVADSHPARERANREALDDLADHLRALDLPAERIPRVLQYNKRDLAERLPLERLRAALNPGGAPDFEATASAGRGVAETLRCACKAALAELVAAPRAAAGSTGAAMMSHGVAPTAPGLETSPHHALAPTTPGAASPHCGLAPTAPGAAEQDGLAPAAPADAAGRRDRSPRPAPAPPARA